MVPHADTPAMFITTSIAGWLVWMAAAARRDHRRQERLDDMNRAHQVDVDHRLPMLMGELVDGAPRRHTRDVHHHIHCRVASVDVRRERGHLVVVGDVEGAVFGHLGAQRTCVGDGLLQALGVAVGEIELGAVGGQLQRGRAADPAGGPGDETTFARKAAPLRHGGEDTVATTGHPTAR